MGDRADVRSRDLAMRLRLRVGARVSYAMIIRYQSKKQHELVC